MNIVFYIFFIFFVLSLLLPFLLVAEIIEKAMIEKKTGKENTGVHLFPIFIPLFFIIALPIICTLMGDFSPLWETNIFILTFGMLVSSYLLAYLLLVIISLIKFR